MSDDNPNIPLEKLVEMERNVYEITNAAIKRADQLAITKADDLKEKKIKIVTAAMYEVFNDKVHFRCEE